MVATTCSRILKTLFLKICLLLTHWSWIQGLYSNISKAEIYSSLLLLGSNLMYNFFKTKQKNTYRERTAISGPSWLVIVKLLNTFTYFSLFTHLSICFLFKIGLDCLPDLLSKLNVWYIFDFKIVGNFFCFATFVLINILFCVFLKV